MPPEVFRGSVHRNSDQYSLALTYWELRTGQRFVTTQDMVEAMLQHVEKAPDLSAFEPAEGETECFARKLRGENHQFLAVQTGVHKCRCQFPSVCHALLLQRFGNFVLAIAASDRVDWRRLGSSGESTVRCIDEVLKLFGSQPLMEFAGE